MNKDSTITRRQFLKQSLAIGSITAFSISPSGKLFSQNQSSQLPLKIKNFKSPYGIALDPEHRIYVSDAADYCIKVFDRSGKFLLKFGKPGSGGDHFNYPQGLFIDAGFIYVMDSNNGRIAIFNLEGRFISSIGTIGGYPEAFYTPKGIFVNDKIYACNTRNHFISVWDKQTHRLINKLGDLGDDPVNLQPGSVEYKFRLPTDLTVTEDGRIYVVDSKHGEIKVLDAEGKFLFKFGEIGSEEGQFNFPEGIALDQSENVYVCDPLNSRIQKFNSEGKYISTMTAGLKKPTTLRIDEKNTLYIVDAELNQVIITKWKS